MALSGADWNAIEHSSDILANASYVYVIVELLLLVLFHKMDEFNLQEAC